MNPIGGKPVRSTTLLSIVCDCLGIDISGIPNTEAASAEETYRFKLQLLMLAQQLENSESKLRRMEESAAKDKKEIQELRSRLEEGREISRTLSVAARNMEMALGSGGGGAAAAVVGVAVIPPNNPRQPEVAKAINLNELAKRRPERPRQTARKPGPLLHQRGIAALGGGEAEQLEGGKAAVGIPQAMDNTVMGSAVVQGNDQRSQARCGRIPRIPQQAVKSCPSLHPRRRRNNL